MVYETVLEKVTRLEQEKQPDLYQIQKLEA